MAGPGVQGPSPPRRGHCRTASTADLQLGRPALRSCSPLPAPVCPELGRERQQPRCCEAFQLAGNQPPFPPHPAAAGRQDAAMLGAGRHAAPLSAARGRPRPALPPPPRGLRSRVRAPPPAPGSPGWGRPKAGGSGVAPRLLLYSLQAFVQVIAASSVLSRALLQVTVQMRLALYRLYPSRNKYSNLTVLGNFEPLISRGSQDP